jgi:hypothetical protein
LESKSSKYVKYEVPNYSKKRKAIEAPHSYLMVSKKEFTNSPNIYMKAKQDKITVLRQEAMYMNSANVRSISLAKQDLIT